MATHPKYPPLEQPIADKATGFRADRVWALFFQDLVNQAAAAGSVTHTTGPLTVNEVLLGNGGDDIKALGAYGTAGQVLASNGAGLAPSFQSLSALGVLKQGATTVMNDATIKALPAAAFGFTSLVPAPGAGLRIIPIGIDLEANFVGGYTNVNADAFLAGTVEQGVLMSAIANDSTIPISNFTTFMGAGQTQTWLPALSTVELVNSWGSLGVVQSVTIASTLNQPMGIIVNNNGAGNFTGGNASNMLTMTPYYVTVNY